MHTPWFYFIMAPMYRFFRVDSSVSEAVAFLFFARQISWALTALIFLATIGVGTLWRNAATGFVAALFLTNTEMFLTTTLEARPDMLSTLCAMSSLAVLLSGLKTEAHPPSKWYFFVSGMLAGAGVMFTQKLLFMLPGLAVAMAWHVLTGWREQGRRRLAEAATMVAGFCVPVGLTVLYFSLKGGSAHSSTTTSCSRRSSGSASVHASTWTR